MSRRIIWIFLAVLVLAQFYPVKELFFAFLLAAPLILVLATLGSVYALMVKS